MRSARQSSAMLAALATLLAGAEAERSPAVRRMLPDLPPPLPERRPPPPRVRREDAEKIAAAEAKRARKAAKRRAGSAPEERK